MEGQFLCGPRAHVDDVGMYEHELAHNVIVLHESVEIYGPGKAWSRALRAGDVFDLDAPLAEYEIAALEDRSETLHMHLHGMPEAYKALPASEVGGVVDRPCSIRSRTHDERRAWRLSERSSPAQSAGPSSRARSHPHGTHRERRPLAVSCCRGKHVAQPRLTRAVAPAESHKALAGAGNRSYRIPR
jgi:hypothetical protein